MKCFNCGAELDKKDFCPGCGISVRIYKKIVHTSNFYYNQGLDRATVRDLSGAAESLRKSLRFQKGNIQARNLLGLVLFEMGETVSALGEWVISKSMMPENNDAEKYLDAIQKNPARLDTINQTIKKYNQALLYCRQDSTDLAIIQLKKVLSLNPKLVKGHQLLALLYIKEGQYERAKKSLRAALKVDSANTLSLRYMRETNQMLRESNSGKKKKPEDDLISYRSGNDLIIQPTRLKDTSGFSTVVAVLAGIVIGVAVTCFLVVPGIRQNAKQDANTAVNQANETIASKNQEITSLENQITDLNNRLEDEAADSDTLLDRVTSYDQLLQAYQLYLDDESISSAETLANVNRDYLTEDGQAIYDDLADEVNSGYILALYEQAATDYNERNYEEAAEGFEKVVAIDEKYEDGDVLYFLAQCYRNLGEDEKAITYYQKVTDLYPGTEHAANAQEYLAELQESQ